MIAQQQQQQTLNLIQERMQQLAQQIKSQVPKGLEQQSQGKFQPIAQLIKSVEQKQQLQHQNIQQRTRSVEGVFVQQQQQDLMQQVRELKSLVENLAKQQQVRGSDLTNGWKSLSGEQSLQQQQQHQDLVQQVKDLLLQVQDLSLNGQQHQQVQQKIKAGDLTAEEFEIVSVEQLNENVRQTLKGEQLNGKQDLLQQGRHLIEKLNSQVRVLEDMLVEEQLENGWQTPRAEQFHQQLQKQLVKVLRELVEKIERNLVEQQIQHGLDVQRFEAVHLQTETIQQLKQHIELVEQFLGHGQQSVEGLWQLTKGQKWNHQYQQEQLVKKVREIKYQAKELALIAEQQVQRQQQLQEAPRQLRQAKQQEQQLKIQESLRQLIQGQKPEQQLQAQKQLVRAQQQQLQEAQRQQKAVKLQEDLNNNSPVSYESYSLLSLPIHFEELSNGQQHGGQEVAHQLRHQLEQLKLAKNELEMKLNETDKKVEQVKSQIESLTKIQKEQELLSQYPEIESRQSLFQQLRIAPVQGQNQVSQQLALKQQDAKQIQAPVQEQRLLTIASSQEQGVAKRTNQLTQTVLGEQREACPVCGVCFNQRNNQYELHLNGHFSN